MVIHVRLPVGFDFSPDILHFLDNTVCWKSMHGKLDRTVVVGGGFAGIHACRALRNAPTEVVLIDPSPLAAMVPALPDLAGGWIPERLISRSISDLLPDNARHVESEVLSIDLRSNFIVWNGGSTRFDYLVIAAGSVPVPPPATICGNAINGLSNLSDARRIRDAFLAHLQSKTRPTLLVAGGGFTGLELAASLQARAQLAGRDCKTTIVDPANPLLPFLPDNDRRRVMEHLGRRNVEILAGSSLDLFDGKTARAGNRVFDEPFVCWTAGSTSPLRNVEGKVERLRDGRFKVGPSLSLPGYDHVFAAGDSAAFFRNGQPIRKSVNHACGGGKCAGENIARLLCGRPVRPFRPVDPGWIIPLHDESVGRIHPGLKIQGSWGVRLHFFMCGARNFSFSNFAGCFRRALNPYPKEQTR